jgi:hypothetical protein
MCYVALGGAELTPNITISLVTPIITMAPDHHNSYRETDIIDVNP